MPVTSPEPALAEPPARAVDDRPAALPAAGALDEPSLLRFEDALLRIVRTIFRPSVQSLGTIDKAGYVTLARLGRCGAGRLSDLAAGLELDLSTVSRQVKILESAGLVRRTADPADGRAAVVDLSDAGRQELARQRDHRFQTLTTAFAGMPVRDRDRLVHLLDQLADGVSPDALARTTGRTAR